MTTTRTYQVPVEGDGLTRQTARRPAIGSAPLSYVVLTDAGDSMTIAVTADASALDALEALPGVVPVVG